MKVSFILEMARFEGLSWVRRSPETAIGYAATPLALLFLIYVLSGGKLIEYAIVGGFVAQIGTSAIMTAGSIGTFRIILKLQDLLIATKISKVDYVLGLALANMIFCAPGLAIYAAIALYLGLFTVTNVLITVVVIGLVLMAMMPISFFVGSIFRRTNGIWTTASVLAVALTMLPPSYYPYTLLPKPLLYALMISPVTPGAMILQGYYGISPINNYAFAVLAIEAVLYFVLAGKFTPWGDK
ncbi:MAG: ABC transporter permease [Candidatus Micrarchaeota archaeon]|nr:ABC transporter permease [Candidatus Micrarchaeota archaeon]